MTVSEDRGTPAWIWRDAEGYATFARPSASTGAWVVSVPIGWRMRPDPILGVELVDTFGDTLSASAVLYYAERGERGFRVREREEVWG